MSGITDVNTLLADMAPTLQDGEFVFCTVDGDLHQFAHLNPVGTFVETEGLTLVLPRSQAETANLPFSGVFRQITLQVHSSLEAVGLTTAVSKALTEQNISANVIAAFYHDHVFVRADKSAEALQALRSLSE
jgi:hypothetical protein